MGEAMTDMPVRSTALRNEPIYLDNFSTTVLAPEVANAIVDAWSLPGNASSPHTMGARAAMIVDHARSSVASLVGAAPSEIYFTSGATEANNMVLLGVANAASEAGIGRNKIIVSSIEHKSVLAPAASLASRGFEIVSVRADRRGLVDLQALAAALDEQTLLVSVMGANNETGVIQPIEQITSLAREVGALTHSDCAQMAGKCPIDVLGLDVDYLSLSGHKIYGPMGVGALFISASALRPAPLVFGGGQQAGIRPGTEPVPMIAGLGAAAELAVKRMDLDCKRADQLRDLFLTELFRQTGDIEVVTQDAQTLPGSLCLKVGDVAADDLIASVQRDLAISTGSACNAGQVMPSHVLVAMGFNQVQAESIFRVYFGRYNSEYDAIHSALILANAVRQIRRPTGQPRQ